ncbi:MAG: class I SAM-dependent methyltransferase [Flavobacterium sp.]|nr:MAG: class I SAM-dependent methyltransferase [Flavobacterium sp.]
MEFNYIESLVLRLCKQPRSFEYLSMNAQSYDPTDLYKTLKVLEKKNFITNFDGLWCLKNHDPNSTIINNADAKAKFFNEHIGFFALFEKPHPLDFEWRNSVGSLDFLVKHIECSTFDNDRILLLGFPTLFAATSLKEMSQHITLVDKNQPVIKDLEKLISKDNFNIVEADIFKVDPDLLGKYQMVILDPPWYSPHFYDFIWLAAKCVEIGGSISISIPPINARPSIPQERIQWFSFCQENGLCLENLYSQKLSYAMPFFEFNAFRIAGVKDVLPFWRKGDLAIFKKTENIETLRPLVNDVIEEWIEIQIDTVRFRIKMDKTTGTKLPLQIHSIVDTEILPSISARDIRRNEANVWTSGNRIYKVQNSAKFVTLLEHIKSKKFEKIQEKDVAKQIELIIKFEKEEYNNYLDWLYHEMERHFD